MGNGEFGNVALGIGLFEKGFWVGCVAVIDETCLSFLVNRSLLPLGRGIIGAPNVRLHLHHPR